MGEQRGLRRLSSAAVARTVGMAGLAYCAVVAIAACSSAPSRSSGQAGFALEGLPTTVAGSSAAGNLSPDGGPTATVAPAESSAPGPAAASAPPITAAPTPGEDASSGSGTHPISSGSKSTGPSGGAAAPAPGARASSPASGNGSALHTVAPGDATDPPSLTLGPGTPSAAEAEVIRLVNVERAAIGCPTLVVSPLLVQIARAHSQEMSAPGSFRHNSPDGRTPFQRLAAAGYDYSIATENIAAGQPNAAAVMAAWTARAEHKSNMLDCRLTQIGVGVVNRPGSPYGIYWTQEIATPL